MHLHMTSVVNNMGIKKLFKSVRNHRNLIVFEMSEIQMNSITWNSFINIFKCNTNLQVFKLHFKYKPWHKILDNKKLNMSNNDPLKIIEALINNIYINKSKCLI